MTAAVTQRCAQCRVRKHVSEFYRDLSRTSRLQSRCKPCDRRRFSNFRKANRRRPDNLAKDKARRSTREAVRSGRIIKPRRCSQCNRVTKSVNLHAHHHRGYSHVRALDVVFICRNCHRNEHRPTPIPAEKIARLLRPFGPFGLSYGEIAHCLGVQRLRVIDTMLDNPLFTRGVARHRNNHYKRLVVAD